MKRKSNAPPSAFAVEREELDVRLSRRALPSMYAVLDEHGRELWRGPDAHTAWRMLCDLDDARSKVDADHPTRVFAARGRRRTDAETTRIARAMVWRHDRNLQASTPGMLGEPSDP